MIRYLLPKDGNFYKANLHCHSTDSDGRISPEELAEGYRSRGYSILAITDHRKMPDRSHLCTDDLLVLNGYEFNHVPYPMRGRSIHMNLIAKDQKNLTLAPLEPVPEGKECTTDPEFTAKINNMVKTANEAGFLTIYNHMRWSHDTEADALSYDGFFAMEIFNHFSEVVGVEEYNLSAYVSMIRAGKKLFAVMADDNHNSTESPAIGFSNLDRWINHSADGYRSKPPTSNTILSSRRWRQVTSTPPRVPRSTSSISRTEISSTSPAPPHRASR